MQTQVSHRAQWAPSSALHPRSATQLAAAPAAARRAPIGRSRPQPTVYVRAEIARGGSNSLRTPHSGYHWDGTPRRCEWCRAAPPCFPAWPWAALGMGPSPITLNTTDSPASLDSMHSRNSDMIPAILPPRRASLPPARLLFMLFLQSSRAGTSRSLCPETARALPSSIALKTRWETTSTAA